MRTKRVLKKKVKIGLIIFVSAIVVLVIGIKSIKYHNSDIYKLKKLGYDKSTSNEIIKLEKSKLVLENKYNSKILDILNSKYFLEKNLSKYIDYYEKNTSTSIDDIIALVNVHRDNEYYTLDLKADTSLGYSMLVNKYYSLDKNYVPDNLYKVSQWYGYGSNQLIEEIYDAFIEMADDAEEEDLKLVINEAYRSYEDQKEIYDEVGAKTAAKPGHSEHNASLAVDITTDVEDDFDTTDEYKWLIKNSYKYGFILRYPKGKENITGYDYEPWHFRYLGKDLAKEVFKSGLTFDEYYAYYIEK